MAKHLKINPLLILSLGLSIGVFVGLHLNGGFFRLPSAFKPKIVPANIVRANEIILNSEKKIKIPWMNAREFDGLTKNQIMNERVNELSKFPELVDLKNYSPVPEVFGMIVDGKPWWGTHGQYFFGSGGRSPEGPSEEAFNILNPFVLLVPYANIYGREWGAYHWERWKEAHLNEAQIVKPDFPLFLMPESGIYEPGKKRVEVYINASHFFDRLSSETKLKIKKGWLSFELEDLNARDFGYNYAWFDRAHSKNANQKEENYNSKRAYKTQDYIHLGGSCGYPGGCNNASPQNLRREGFYTEAWPAEFYFKLWKQEPIQLSDPADLDYRIKID